MVSDQQWLDDHQKLLILICTTCRTPRDAFEGEVAPFLKDGFYYMKCRTTPCSGVQTIDGVWAGEPRRFAKIKKNQFR